MSKLTLRKKRFRITLGLSLVLVLNAILFLYFSMRDNGLDSISSKEWITFVIIVLLAAIAPIAVKYKFDYLSKSYEKEKLEGDYGVIYEDIKDYIGLSRIPKKDKREIYNDIYDILFEGYKDERAVESVVGEDYKVFVNEILQIYESRNLLIHDLITGLQFFIGYIIFFKLFYYFEGGEAVEFYKQAIPGGLIFYFFIVSMISLPYLYRYFRTFLKSNKKYLLIAISGIVIPSILMIFNNTIFGDQSRITVLMDKEYAIVGSPLELLLWLLFFCGLFFARNLAYKEANKINKSNL